MFRRKEDGTEEFIPDNEVSITPVSSGAGTPASAQPSAASSPSTPYNAPSAPVATAPAFRPVPVQPAMAAQRQPANAPAPSAPAHAAAPVEPVRAPIVRPNAKRVLTVGPDIQMKGEITNCDRVVIEGMVDATMRDVHTVELAETGSLKGTAEVEDAEISGAFEGDLVVTGKLTIHSSGRVRGNITYGDIEIQRGGQISGNVRNSADAKTNNNHQPNKKAA